MTTTLVTGVNGFVGGHLVDELRARGHVVVGLGADAAPRDGLMLDDYVEADLTRPIESLPEYDHVVHLAGLSAVGPSFDDPRGYYETNGAIAFTMLDWHAAHGRGRFLMVSTGAVYDPADGPVDEEAPIGHTSPYVVSKLLVEDLTLYHRRRGVDAVIARPFNHIGPGQGPGFLVPDLVAGLTEAKHTGEPPRFGDLTSARDYTDVRDVVRAYVSLLAAPELGEAVFNVCSGHSTRGIEILSRLAALMGIDLGQVGLDEARVRPTEQSVIVGDHRRLTSATGWEPSIPLDQSLADAVP